MQPKAAVTADVYASDCRRTTHESLAGAFGIPEWIPPICRGTFIIKEGSSCQEEISFVFPSV